MYTGGADEWGLVALYTGGEVVFVLATVLGAVGSVNVDSSRKIVQADPHQHERAQDLGHPGDAEQQTGARLLPQHRPQPHQCQRQRGADDRGDVERLKNQ
jgi:hypothetical protein